MILKVLHYPHSLLKYKTHPVEKWNQDLLEFVDVMIQTMLIFDGIGLAANQVGVSKRLLVFEPRGVVAEDSEMEGSEPEAQRGVLINPQVEVLEEPFLFHNDACVSFPGVVLDTERYQFCRVSYQNVAGERHTLEAKGLLAVVLQHEIDHLNGQVFLERSREVVSEKKVRAAISKAVQARSYQALLKKHKVTSWPQEKLTF